MTMLGITIATTTTTTTTTTTILLLLQVGAGFSACDRGGLH